MAAAAIVFATVVLARGDYVHAVSRKSSVGSSVVEGLVALGFSPGGRLELTSERFETIAHALPVAPPAAIPGRADRLPAMILITLEATRPDRLGCGGHERATSPSIDAFARTARWTPDAWTTTNASRHALVSLLSGRYRDLESPPGDEIETAFAAWMAQSTETIAIFPRGGLLEKEDLFGRFERVVEYEGPSERAADLVGERLAESIPRPLFLWVHLVDPHSPYEPREEDRIFGEAPIDLYDGEIRAMDRAFGRIVGMIDRFIGVERSAVAVTSDHGEAFGEHGFWFHKTGLHEEQVRVPVFFRAPGLAPGPLPAPISHVDVLPTLCALAGWPFDAGFDGQDLGLAARGGSVAGEAPAAAKDGADASIPLADAARRPIFARHERRGIAVRLGSRKLIASVRLGAFELFDLAADPGEKSPETRAEIVCADPLFDLLLAFDTGPDGLLYRSFGGTAIRAAKREAATSDDAAVRRFAGK